MAEQTPVESAPNPFLAASPEPIAQAPVAPVSAPEASNPFLAPDPAPPAAPSQPRVVPPQAGAPLQAQPGAVVPSVSDPHAEFRRGSWKKPVGLAAVAAAIAGGLFYGIPEQSEDAAPAYAAAAESPVPVIGASVSPDVIPDPTKATLANPNPMAGAAKAPPVEEAQPAPEDRPDRSGGFASAFKSAAK